MSRDVQLNPLTQDLKPLTCIPCWKGPYVCGGGAYCKVPTQLEWVLGGVCFIIALHGVLERNYIEGFIVLVALQPSSVRKSPGVSKVLLALHLSPGLE